MRAGIYSITNNVDGKVYIGQSQDVDKRCRYHFIILRNGNHINKHLQNAYNKYGENSFTFDIIEECCVDSLDEREIFYIEKLKAFNNGYNMTIGGGGRRGYQLSDESKEKIRQALYGNKAFLGRKHSDETKKKISIANKGHEVSEKQRLQISESQKGRKRPPITEEHRRKLSEWQKGKKRKPLSEEHKNKIGASLKGKTRSPEACRNISEGQKGKVMSEETKRKMSIAAKNRVVSEETRAKLSESTRLYWERKRMEGK